MQYLIITPSSFYSLSLSTSSTTSGITYSDALMRRPALLTLVASGLQAALASPHVRRGSALDKPAVYPPFPEALQNRDLPADLPRVAWKREPWEPNWLPQNCVFEAAETGFRPADFEATETVCRHKLARPSFAELLDTLSRIPVGMRQYIDNLILLPPVSNTTTAEPPPEPLPAAYTRTATIVVAHPHLNLGILLHEAAHILDTLSPALQQLQDVGPDADTNSKTNNNNNNNNNTPFSDSPLWQAVVAGDAALPTAYARTSWQEDFADAVRWAVSYMVHDGGLRGYSAGWAGCRGQVPLRMLAAGKTAPSNFPPSSDIHRNMSVTLLLQPLHRFRRPLVPVSGVYFVGEDRHETVDGGMQRFQKRGVILAQTG
ncbi:hypothetical protein BT67DRAFT_494076 [Trichocladium antarcticum]|uniref:Uncharacterized protein n=1 Tax=Trichocladium antarcticum TaxID=1450529 RepID=A0AAN6ULI5_9PEZI|nr:hypothetical protein BT67DRAFT_494076 [Trichocladium antarcticum]